VKESIPEAARSKAWVCGCLLARIAGLNPAGMSASCECCDLSDSGLCDGPITRPEESYRVCVCLMECDLETSTIRMS
jgi:hypothetical protein